MEFIVQPNAHSAAADINDAVSALRLVLQLGQVPCFLSDPNGSIERRAITVGRRNQNPQANRALLFKAPREAVGLFILVVEPETLVQRIGGPSARWVSPVRPLELALKRPF